MSKKAIEIAVASGDGIGKEIMTSVLAIFKAAKVPLNFNHVDMGKEIYLKGFSSGMTNEAKETVERLGILFKGPMETPKGSGVKSINVTARKVWSTYANKRVFRTIPGVDTVFARAGIPIDLTMVRENIEDTYGGIEHMQTNDVAQCRRLITRPGCEQVHRYAFEMAKAKGHRRVTCAHKANIMKLTDGLFLETFRQVAKDYPGLKVDDVIVDDLAMKLVSRPDTFDVIVLPNLQGDILSDLCAGLVGGLGMAPSANIGDQISIFEAVHGTAPDIVGKDIANPTALLMSGLMMLRHLHLDDYARVVEGGLMGALKQGYRTKDVATANDKLVKTTEFTQRIIENMDMSSLDTSKPIRALVRPQKPLVNILKASLRDKSVEATVGIDIFVDTELKPQELAALLQKAIGPLPVKLVMLSNRGTQVWPTGSVYTECINHFRARFQSPTGSELKPNDLLGLATRVNDLQVRVCSLEMLLKLGDKMGFTLAQGQ